MPKVVEAPPNTLRPYIFHGLDLQWRSSDKEALADCPWCGRGRKFSVNIETGMWRCLVCNEGTDNGNGKEFHGGNALIFIRMLWEKSMASTPVEDYKELAANRKLLFFDTLVQAEVCKSITTRDWLVPGFNPEGKMTGLYRYVKGQDRMLLLPTPTFGSHLFGMNLFSAPLQEVYICEGPWDYLALWEVFANTKQGEDGFSQTANREHSLLREANVIGVPGCQVMNESWLSLFQDRIVNFMYDNDYPKKHPATGKELPPAGYSAMEAKSKMLSAYKYPPREINFLRWGENGYTPSYPDGHDVRDFLCQST